MAGDCDPLPRIDPGNAENFRLGQALVSPSRRTVSLGERRQTIEPRMMQVLIALAERPGRLVTRQDLFARCWEGMIVGDDSLNRVIGALRKLAAELCEGQFRIVTVPKAGYALETLFQAGTNGTDETRYDCADGDAAIERGWQSFRHDAPVVDYAAIDGLRRAVASFPGDSRGWAMLALMARNAAEYAEPSTREDYVHECEAAARRALELDSDNATARAALIGLSPIFGDWDGRRHALEQLRRASPDSPPVLHESAILEMATGRPSAAMPIVERLLEQYPLAPAFLYKRIYHLWTLGRIEEMDQVADRAVQLWPRHMAIGMARHWSLMGTGRIMQARVHLRDLAEAAAMPPAASAIYEATLDALETGGGSGPQWRAAVNTNLAAARIGPVFSVAAIIQLAILGAIEQAFEVADGYYLQRGSIPVGLKRSADEPPITDQSRRVTQLLFIPATRPMRSDPRFDGLMEAIGLDRHWRLYALRPDHRLQAAA